MLFYMARANSILLKSKIINEAIITRKNPTERVKLVLNPAFASFFENIVLHTIPSLARKHQKKPNNDSSFTTPPLPFV